MAETELCTNQGCKALIARDDAIMPLYGLTLMQILKAEIQSLATGTTFTEISTSKLGDVPVPLPPLPEQAAIVKYLDFMDRRIGRYVRAKQKLIDLLNEQKQAVVQRTITKGLDASVRLKPSGLEWVGAIPEHWEAGRA
ncbi:type I restriction-modification system, S subunit, partial [mine drainage metagenome]